MFTEVIIFGLVLISIAALWVSASLKTIKTGTKGIYKVFEKPKGKPRGPGLVFVPYGIATIDPVDITRKSKNVPSFSFPVTFHKETSIDADDPNIDIEKVLMTNAHTPEISISIEPDLSQLSGESETDALLRFYSYIRNTSDDTVWENIRDRTEAAVTKHVRFMGIANAKLAGKNIFDKIRDEVKKDLKDEGVPVKIISFVVNTGIKGDKAVEDEISRAATSIMKQRADLQDTARELEVAKKKESSNNTKLKPLGSFLTI